MPINPTIRAAVVALMMPGLVLAQTPLSVIDWLEPSTGGPNLPPTILLEPPVSNSVLSPQIQVTPLEALLDPIGIVSSAATGLPIDLWRGSDPQVLSRLIDRVPVQHYPAMQSLLYTVLLSEARPPSNVADADTILLARLDRLMALGAVDPAQALAQQADPAGNTARFARWFDTTLLTGDEDVSCNTLISKPYLAPDDRSRIFCMARSGDWETAALLLETAHALGTLPPPDLALLDRFLSPGIFEDAPPLSAPSTPDPLTFRLYETIGERLPTTQLPRSFAAADLRDVAGWKAQLEAAERLTRIGALNPNQLLGLYTDRRPAASGGIWDRVDAVQRFDTALRTGSADAVSKTLPKVWKAMQQAGLEVAFADLFGDQLARIDLQGPAGTLAWRIRLLSTSYEAAALMPAQGSDVFLVGLALGSPKSAYATTARDQAISRGFSPDSRVSQDLQRLLADGRLGEAILRTMEMFDRGAQGNLQDLSDAIAGFRAVGLEDTARRASLQLLLLERS
ncbi:hypothetical protein K3727_11270 [Rhodobacteraceae bacterium M382]|nr:hypothetical protein K3727_11270 [Rhodobacteraceae bacterium M382]